MQSNTAVHSIANYIGKPKPSHYTSAPIDSNPCQICFHKSDCLARNLSPEESLSYNRTIQSKRCSKGEYLFRLSEPLQALYRVVSGSVKSIRLDEDGNEQVVGFHIAGDLLALDAIGGGFHPSSAVLLEDSFVCKIPSRVFNETFPGSQRLQTELIQHAAKALQSEQLHTMFLRKNPAHGRLAMFLADLSGRLKSRNYASDRIDLSLSRRDIGNYLGLALETVSRCFTHLQDAGIINVHHRHITILDPAGLELQGRGPSADPKAEYVPLNRPRLAYAN